MLSRTGWTATSAGGGDVPANALDGNLTTRWNTGVPQADGQWFQVDMLAAQSFCTITLDAAGFTGDYPTGYTVYATNNLANFGSAIATGTGNSQLITITFAAQSARYIKIVRSGGAGSANWWSIAELNVKH